MSDWREKKGGRGSKRSSREPAKKKSGQASESQGWRSKKTRTQDSSSEETKTYLGTSQRKKLPKHIGKLNILLVLLAVLIGTFIYKITRKPSKVAMLHITIADYQEDSAFPPNAYAFEDRDHFHYSMKQPGSNITLDARKNSIELITNKPEPSYQQGHIVTSIQTFLDKHDASGPGSGGWIFYLSCHGITGNDGLPYLAVSDSQMYNPDDGLLEKRSPNSTLVPLTDLLKAIEDHEVVQANPKSYKLIVLDCGRMQSNWAGGMLVNDFPSAVKKLIKEKSDTDATLRNTFFLLASDDGQAAWAAPEINGTLFGQAFAEGLLGKADLPDSEGSIGDDDDMVSLDELYHYCVNQVENIASAKRFSLQTPQLVYPESEDWKSVQLVRRGTADFTTSSGNLSANDSDHEIKTTGNQGSPLSRMNDMWEAHTELEALGASKITPLPYALIQQDLFHAEQLSYAGKYYEAKCNELCTTLEGKLIDLAHRLAELDPNAYRGLSRSRLEFFSKEKFIRDLDSKLSEFYPSIASWSQYHLTTDKAPYTLKELHDNREERENAAALLKSPPAEKKPVTSPEGETASAPAVSPADPAKQVMPLVCENYHESAYWLLQELAQPAKKEVTQADLEVILEHLSSANEFPQIQLNRGFEPVEVEFLRRLLRFYERASDEIFPDVKDVDSPLPALVAQAIRSRVMVEKISLPSDERIGPWIDTRIDQADTNRRLAEDYLFAAHFSAAKDPLSRLFNDYAEIQLHSQKLERAFRYRDVLRQSLPSLTQWVAHHPFTAKKQEELLTHCLQLAKFANQLDIELSPENPGRADAPNDELLREIKTHFNDIVGVWEKKAGDIGDGSAAIDNARLLETMNLLRTGTIGKLDKTSPTHYQTGLWNNLHRGITNKNLPKASPENTKDLEDKTQSVLRNALLLCKKSPWELFYPGETNLDAEFYNLNIKGRASDPNSLDELKPGTSNTQDRSYIELQKLNTNPNGDIGLNHFQRAVRASQALRIGHLSLLQLQEVRSNIENRETAPIYAYEALRKQRMIWQASRSLNDFWGPIYTKGKSPSADSYFERLVASYLVEAKPNRQGVPLPDYDQLQDQDLALLSRSWNSNLLPEELVIEDSSEPSSLLTGLQFGDKVPLGYSAIEIVTSNGKLVKQLSAQYLENNCHAVPIKDYQSAPPGSSTLPQFVQRFRYKEYIPQGDLFVRTRYRGHEKRAVIPIDYISDEGIKTRTYTVNLPAPVEPKIEVQADDLGKGDVIFILDCSSSMTPDRMAAAKGALIDVLRSLSAGSNFRVQVVAFGHRIHVGKNSEDLTNVPGYVVPEGVTPDNDVQFLLSESWTTLVPGQAKTALQTDVETYVDEIEKLNGHGITPLYESIRQALNKITPGNNSHIIAITDGVNVQFKSLAASKKTTALILQTMLKRDKRDVKLHIAGFRLPEAKDLPEGERPTPNTVEELGWLAGEGRGDFFNVIQRIALVENIKALVTTNEHFTVTQTGGKQTGENRFNDIWTASRKVNNRTDFTIETHQLPKDASMQVELSGGEFLRLFYDTQRKLLAFLPEKGEVVTNAPLKIKTGEYQVEFLHSKAPKNQGGLLEIPIRIRNEDDTLFSYKPYHIWAEIFAIEGGRISPDPYILTDLNFENGKQYPRFLLSLPDWPANATKAKVMLSIEMDKRLSPLKTFPLDDSGKINLRINNAPGKPEFVAGDLILESTGGETNDSDAAYLISVEVRPKANEKSIASHHIEFKSDQVQPIKIERTYRYDIRDPKIVTQVDHRFYFKSAVALKGSSPELKIWSKTELTQGVQQIEVELKIPQN